MYQETMSLIHQRATERLNLYRAAAKQGLSQAQFQRLHELDNELPTLWERYRREFAGRNRSYEAAPARRAA
jgi:hypothetical protein